MMLHTAMTINKQTLISPRATANMFPVRCGASVEGDQHKRLQTRTGDNFSCQSTTEASLSLHCLTVQQTHTPKNQANNEQQPQQQQQQPQQQFWVIAFGQLFASK